MKTIRSGSREFDAFIKALKSRKYKEDKKIEQSVSRIIADVRKNGDKAVIKYTRAFDKVVIKKSSDLLVTKNEIKEAVSRIPVDDMKSFKRAAVRIKAFHMRELRSGWIYEEKDGTITGQKIRPLAVVGIYVPGGKAAYPSSVLMNAIPAKVAGVGKIIMCTPPSKDGMNPYVLAAADIAGVDEIYRAGGAQAVAAMAYGTDMIPAVDKIVGPGNIFVATAKKQVFGAVGIDMIAGPTEIVIVADESANSDFIACDMISQAEHDENASAICITTSSRIAKGVNKTLEKRLKGFARREIASKSLERFGAVITVPSIEEALKVANTIAPEHLELMVKDPVKVSSMVENAGAMFLGAYSPEPIGDYVAGPNHVLPTGGTARFSSPLSVDDFTKKTSIIYIGKKAFDNLSGTAISIAETEGLVGHAMSVKVRVDK